MIDITHCCFVAVLGDDSIKSILDHLVWQNAEYSITTTLRIGDWCISLPIPLLNIIKKCNGTVICENSRVKVVFDNKASMTKFKLSL